MLLKYFSLPQKDTGLLSKKKKDTGLYYYYYRCGVHRNSPHCTCTSGISPFISMSMEKSHPLNCESFLYK